MTDDDRWTAVLDHRTDVEFLYAVTTTHVFCRPSCPSRRPRRENVRFFETVGAAQRAGFRGCLRCRPADDSLTDERVERVTAACAALSDGCTWNDAVAASPVGADTLRRDFRHVLGVTPKQWIDGDRVERFRAELARGRSVTDATYAVGYGSSSRVYERSDGMMGMTPATYGKRGEGATIGFAVVDSPFGRLLVAATERGVCRVRVGDDDATLESALRAELPAADITRDDDALAATVQGVLDLIAGHEPAAELPVDVRGTAFQLRVWDALTRIPPGTTKSYGEVAAEIGAPTSVRAVGAACGANPVAVIVPCHRVLSADGTLNGYAYGLPMKHALLAAEGVETKG